MATRKHKVIGKAMWAKLFDSNKEMKDWQGNPHPFGGLFKLDMVLDKDNKNIYKASGTAGKGRFDDDGNFIITLKRKENEKFEWAGGPPQVVNSDGSPFTGNIIPNGSIVEAEFSVYTTSMSPGTRLEKVTVLDLAEMSEREGDAPKSQPKPVTKTVSVGTSQDYAPRSYLDDADIPF